MFDVPVSIAAALVGGLADALRPAAGDLATALAIVLFTAAVRLLLVPLAIAAAKGERTRTRLLPKIQALQNKHAKNPQRLRREMAALYEKEGATPLTGCLPMFAQAPFFMVMYRLFVSATVAGHQNLLLAHTLLAAPLGQNWIGVVGGGLLSRRRWCSSPCSRCWARWRSGRPGASPPRGRWPRWRDCSRSGRSSWRRSSRSPRGCTC